MEGYLNRPGLKKHFPPRVESGFMSRPDGTRSDTRVYWFGAGLGLCAGFIDAKFGDLLLTALFVLASTMLLGALRPERPWRWTVVVGIFVPVVQLAAYLSLTQKPYQAQIYESFLGFLTGIAGAYGGALGGEHSRFCSRRSSLSN